MSVLLFKGKFYFWVVLFMEEIGLDWFLKLLKIFLKGRYIFGEGICYIFGFGYVLYKIGILMI